eukprot:835143-Pleurochrysis_carterae.AAC.1
MTGRMDWRCKNIVYEHKFTTKLTNDDKLQLVLYCMMLSLSLGSADVVGYLHNTRSNELWRLDMKGVSQEKFDKVVRTLHPPQHTREHSKVSAFDSL